MEKKIKLLQLTPRIVYPKDDGGKIGIANIFEQFCNLELDVTMLTYIEDDLSEDILKLINPKAKFVSIKNSTKNTKFQIFKSLFSREPLYLRKHISPSILKQIDELMVNEKFDIIHCDHTAMAPIGDYLKQKYNVIFGLRLHNIEWMIWERYANSLNRFSPKRFFVANQAHKLKKREIELINKTDVAFPITKVDKEIAERHAPNSHLVISPGGVNVTDFSPLAIDRNPYRLIIATVYSWVHNVDGLIWFIDKVLPIVAEKYPLVELELIGKNPPDIFRNKKNVIVTGYVDKVQPYLNQASIYIAPLFVGSGVRIKILEAMAMELPVIATSISAEGLNATENEGLFITNDPLKTAQNVIELLGNPDMRKLTGKNARNYILENFTWERNVKLMYDEYMKLLNHTTSFMDKPLNSKK